MMTGFGCCVCLTVFVSCVSFVKSDCQFTNLTIKAENEEDLFLDLNMTDGEQKNISTNGAFINCTGSALQVCYSTQCVTIAIHCDVVFIDTNGRGPVCEQSVGGALQEERSQEVSDPPPPPAP